VISIALLTSAAEAVTDINENIETIIIRQRITESPFFIVVIFLSFSL
jgi:hypothetical protein